MRNHFQSTLTNLHGTTAKILQNFSTSINETASSIKTSITHHRPYWQLDNLFDTEILNIGNNLANLNTLLYLLDKLQDNDRETYLNKKNKWYVKMHISNQSIILNILEN